jgi:hypothetical protein
MPKTVTFELLGSYRRVIAQFAAAAEDASVVRKQFTAHFPDVTLSERQGTLEKAWIESEGNEVFAVEFGLHREFFLSLATGKIDPFVGIVAALSEASEALGFRSVIEKTVLDGRGSVDLWLERASRSIACEISISTTIDHEVKNVGKCLKAGASMVAVICLYEERLKKIKAAVSGSFGTDTAARVGYFQPDEFIAHVKTLPVEAPEKPEVKRRGYKVKTVVSQLSAEAQKEKEAAVNRTIADSLRRK